MLKHPIARTARCATLVAALFAACVSASATPYQVRLTSNGTEYGIANSGHDKPLALIFTTSITASLDDEFSDLSGKLQKSGFAVASLDLPCHGRHAKPKADGLKCWADAVRHSGDKAFRSLYRSITAAISDMAAKKDFDRKSIVAIGVSRGGYIALQAAAYDERIQYAVGLSPVTALSALREFDSVPIPATLGFSSLYTAMASKHVFIEIGNDDQRVGTDEALSFTRNVVKAGGDKPVDMSAFVMPFKGHGISKDDLALDWILSRVVGARWQGQGAAP